MRDHYQGGGPSTTFELCGAAMQSRPHECRQENGIPRGIQWTVAPAPCATSGPRHRLYAPVVLAEALTGYAPNSDAGTFVHVEGCVVTRVASDHLFTCWRPSASASRLSSFLRGSSGS